MNRVFGPYGVILAVLSAEFGDLETFVTRMPGGRGLSSHYPHNFGKQHVELLAAMHLLRGRQRLALADRHV